MQAPGRLLASGREADIYAFGDGLVLRRSRVGRSMALEAKTMAYARDLGYPVPAVDSISDDGIELVMERIEGVSMVEAIASRPWRLRRYGRTLADLHRRLHVLPAPPWVPPAPCGDAGDRLLHLDLHPLNVLVTRTGPVVIDWTHGSAGHPDTDVGLTWVLLVAGSIDAGPVMRRMIRRSRAVLVSSFLADFDTEVVRRQLASVVAWKAEDAHMSPAECEVMRSLV